MGFISTKPRINKTLISLKLVVFFVICGITALHVLHATKPFLLGLNFVEYRNISIIAPFVSILGPLVVGPLADRLAARNPNTFGRTLRLLTAFCLLIAAGIFACLFAIPEVQRSTPTAPLVSFGCDSNGAVIFQERCTDESTCRHWEERVGTVNLTQCTYSCKNPNKYENMYKPWLEIEPTLPPSSEQQSSEFEYDDETTSEVTASLPARPQTLELVDAADSAGVELVSDEAHRVRRQVVSLPEKIYVEPPHLCITEPDSEGKKVVKHCHVYTKDTPNIVVRSKLRAATDENANDTHSEGWCKYPLDGFQCHIPEKQIKYMKALKNGSDCEPMIECLVLDPYDRKGSVLADSDCVATVGSVEATVGGYTIIRLLGDIFPMAALTLLNTAIVIAVRETSEGRGEICRQYAWGAIGYVVLFTPLQVIFFQDGPNHDAALVALIVVIVCFVLGAIVLICATQMPLSPPEWWWHTKTGMLVVPMSAIRRYSPEILVLTLVSILFGTFWSSIHSYLRWTLTEDNLAVVAAIFLVLALFFNVDKFIEYCGHSNIFIAGFAIFIIRFTALTSENMSWLTVTMEIIEPTVIGVIWITVILYMRHAMPRKLTATGQALVVLAFFGLGKGFGALIGLARNEHYPKHEDECIYQWLAVAACIIALAYFVAYNLILAPRCTAKPQHSEELISGSASQNFGNTTTDHGPHNGAASNGNGAGASLNGNGNGSYSPLRVYHNERGKKGQFRY